jgi:hypothetical protein
MADKVSPINAKVREEGDRLLLTMGERLERHR